jgi:hypothetical protein
MTSGANGRAAPRERASVRLENTDFESVESMFRASGYKIESPADLAAIPDEPWDAFVRSRTRFGSWKEMLAAATKGYVERRLGGEA